jgi:4-oxalocrotonate tautomerase
MPIIRVEMLTGRTNEQKTALVSELTDAFVRTAGGTAEGIHVVLNETSSENWAVSGQLLSDR